MSARPATGSAVLAAAPHRIGTVTLVVHDLDAASRFYQDVVGLAVLNRHSDTVLLGSGDTALVELVRDPAARRRSPREAGLFHTAFLLPSRADLGAWLFHASQRGFTLQGAADHSVSEALYLADPEGNGVEIYADRPTDQWPTEGAEYRMASDPLDFRSVVEAAGDHRWQGFPDGGEVGHVHLQVGAIPPAERFYGELLGFDLTCRYPGASFFGSGGYHHQLAANIWNSRNAPPRTEPVTGLAHVELLARDRSIVEATAARLAPSAVATTPIDGGFAVRDPWGTRIHLRTS